MSLTHSLDKFIAVVLLFPTMVFLAPVSAHLFCSIQEGVMEEHVSSPALLNVFVEALVDEVLELRRPLLADSRHLSVDDIVKDPMLMLAYPGRVSLSQFICKDAERPNVNFDVVRPSKLNHLRSHPTRCSNSLRAVLTLLGQHCGVVKARQLKLSILSNKDIVRFDISVDSVLAMEFA